MLRVAVIGGGAAGLCALRHLAAKPNLYLAAGFEQNTQVGGTWIYTEMTGTDENGLPIHSSMYKDLRTNLPKEVMAFPDFPFKSSLPSFIRHEDVLEYLEDYAKHFDVLKLIKFQTVVTRVHPVCSDDCGLNRKTEWEVSYCDVLHKENIVTEKFDAVMVCNGHYAVPLKPNLPGLQSFSGIVMHSHEYRHPEPFKDMRVVCLGAASSGQDICLFLAPFAKKVFLSHNKTPLETPLPENVEQVTGIESLAGKTVTFRNGQKEDVDAILLCTGYHYSFPFLMPDCHLHIEDERVTPLYKHLIHTEYPSLSILGVCKVICPFPQFHNQVKFVLATLDGSLKLPSKKEMETDIACDFEKRLSEGLLPRYAHHMGPRQWSYNDDLSTTAAFESIPHVVPKLYAEIHDVRRTNLMGYKNYNYELVDPNTFKLLLKDS